MKIVKADHWAAAARAPRSWPAPWSTSSRTPRPTSRLLYPDTCTLWQKVGIICREIYGATDVLADKKLREKFHQLQEAGFGHLPICMAKTQYSLSTDPGLVGRPEELRRAACAT